MAINKQRVIMLVDMQSFYASVEKAARPEYAQFPVLVAGDPARRSGVILAACPLAKTFGVKTADRLGEALKKCPDALVIKPRMQTYIEVSLAISDILQSFTDLVEPYSIDEQFLDITHSMHLFGTTETVAQQIQSKIMLTTGVYARIGISENKILAKMACDNFAKKNESGVFLLPKESLHEILWPLPVENMFGIGRRMMHHMQRMGIFTIGELASTPLKRFTDKWGINGQVLWQIANGIDHSPVSLHTFDEQKAIGHQMTLPRDYRTLDEIKVILLELSEEVCRRARQKNVVGQTISVGSRGADFDIPSGFYRQTTMSQPTNFAVEVYEVACRLFLKHWDGLPLRALSIGLTQLSSHEYYQLDLFRNDKKEHALSNVMDAIKDKYGSAAIIRAASLTTAGQVKDRSKKIGGHYS
jgi:DNA polymerase-4